MAIIPKICIKYESDGSKIYIDDETGLYEGATNTGGYGTPNGDRADYAAVLLVYYQPYDGSASKLTDFSTSYVDYNAGHANTYQSSFELDYFKDGYYTYYYVLVPTSITPAEGSIIYNTSTSDLRQYNASLSLVPVYDETYLQDATLYELVKVEELAVVKLKIKYGALDLVYFECDQCASCGCEDEFKDLQYLGLGIDSALIRFNVAPLEAQKIVEKLLKQFKVT